MMPRSQRLKPVAEVAQRAEEAQMKRVVAARQRLADGQHKLTQLTEYREEYRQGLDRQRGGVINLTQLQTARHFLQRLDDAIRQQQAEIVRLEQNVHVCMTGWQDARRQQQSLDGLIDRYRDEERLQRDRKQQARDDDMAGQRWLRQQVQRQARDDTTAAHDTHATDAAAGAGT